MNNSPLDSGYDWLTRSPAGQPAMILDNHVTQLIGLIWNYVIKCPAFPSPKSQVGDENFHFLFFGSARYRLLAFDLHLYLN
jgi:hypothetical protein